MAADSRGTTLPFGSIVLILLFAAGVFVQQFQLQSSRPETADTRRSRLVGIQDVGARLWQDPLEVVVKHRDSAAASAEKGGKQADPYHDAGSVKAFLAGRIGENPDGVVILGAMVFGGPYVEDAEQRRRQRYAILSGLAMHGYEPDDADHIGYFTMPSAGPVPETVAFEWLNHGTRRQAVLLLWLEEDAYAVSAMQPLGKLRDLFNALAPLPAPGIKLKLLGPASSGGLNRMALELRDSKDRLRNPSEIIGRPIEIYSATATAGESYLPGLKGAAMEADLPLLRTTNTDDQLAAAVMAELALRGVADICGPEEARRDYVVLVSEWDTAYGKQLPRQMEQAAGCPRQNTEAAVIKASYLRGLDGKTPGAAGREEKNEPEQGNDKSGQTKINRERADGNSQADYVRRLAGRLREINSQLRSTGRGQVSAVGVLGSDFYDKLVLLQALRAEFPGAVFFTTDLDARYLNSEQYRWTRNMIVASSFGLELAPGLQRRIPPFRDAYQTATFLATHLAFDEALEGQTEKKRELLGRWLKNPRLFEIGRTTAFDLTPWRTAADAASARESCAEGATFRGMERCDEVHPERSRFRLTVWDKILLELAILAFAATLAAYSTRLQDLFSRTSVVLIFLASVTLAIWGSEWLVYQLSEGGTGEPFAWVEGISVWPTVFLRLIATALCAFFIYRAITRFTSIGNKLVAEFELPPAPPPLPDGGSAGRAGLRDWPARWIAAYVWKAPPRDNGQSVDVAVLWNQYRQRAGARARCLRVTPVALLFLIFGYATVVFFGEPAIPYRGTLSLLAERGALIVVPLFVFLMILVVDATTLCRTFTQHLQAAGSNWPDSTVSLFEKRTGITDDNDRGSEEGAGVLNDWIDIRFIARHTEEVSYLIWYPFIIIALLVFARSSLFDNWHMPLGHVLILGAIVGYAVACAVILQITAATARETAISRMRDKLIRAKGASSQLSGQIDALIVSITNLRQGAFRPVTEQPLVRAVLVALSSYGGISIVEYVSLLPG